MNGFHEYRYGLSGGNPLREFFAKGGILSRLIAINLGIWALIGIIRVGFTLSGLPDQVFLNDYVLTYLGAPASPMLALHYFWTILTYNFVHIEFFHILFNMLWLYWMGKIFTEYLTQKQLLWIYILGGISGYLVFMAAFNLFPGFAGMGSSRVIGASASVMAVVAAISFYIPGYTLSLLFFGRVKILYLALGLFILDFLMISSDNPGGHLAHIGGGLLGYLYILLLKNGRLPGVKFPWGFRRKPRMKTYRSGSIRAEEEYNREKKLQQEEIDRILDKIKISGYQSLSPSEKETLFKASRK